MNNDLKSLRKRFEHGRARRTNLESMCKRVDFPYASVDALAILLSKLFEDRLEKCLVILNGNYKTKIKPHHLSGRNGKMRYITSLFNKRYEIGTYTKEEVKNPQMDIEVTIRNGNKLCIKATLDGKVRRIIEEDGFIDCSNLSKDKFEAFTGVGIKKTDPYFGRFSLGGKLRNFSKARRKEYVFVFFDVGNDYFFDQEGNKLFPALSHTEWHREHMDKKITKIKRDYDSSFRHQYSSKAVQYMQRLWSRYPKISSGYGRRLLVQGSTISRTDGSNRASFAHLQNNKERNGFYVKASQQVFKVKYTWNGPNVLIHDLDGNLLNAHRLSSPGIHTVSSKYIDDLVEAVIIRDIDMSKKLMRITINGNRYHFSKKELKEIIYDLSPDCTALMAHIGSIEGNVFKLLVRKNGSLQGYPIHHTGISSG